MKVAGIQHDIDWEQPARNFERLAPLVEAARGHGARLVVLSEMFSTGFSLDSGRIAEAPDGPSLQFLVDLAARLDVWTAGSIPTTARPGARSRLPTNCLVVVAPDATVHRYDKIYPFSYAGEHKSFSPGTHTLTIDIDGLRVTPFVCYDLRFATEWWVKAHDTDLYLCVANWPGSRQQHWLTLLRARAIENQAYVAGVNRVGLGGKLDYIGGTTIIDPFGEIVAEADGATEQVVVGDVDAHRVAEVRRTFPFLEDRRR